MKLRYIDEPARRTRVLAETQVLVVGGGAAGVAAATAAAREGASTLLVERSGALGGIATGGLVVLLLTLDDGRGRQVIAGVCEEVVDRLRAGGAAFHPARGEWGSSDPATIERDRRWGLVWGSPPHAVRYSVAYDPEAMRSVLADLVTLRRGQQGGEQGDHHDGQEQHEGQPQAEGVGHTRGEGHHAPNRRPAGTRRCSVFCSSI